MKRAEQYHVMIVSSTGDKPVFNMGPGLLKLIIFIFILVIIALAVLAYLVLDAYRVEHELRKRIEVQISEIRALNLEIARKDEEIISLKKHVAPAIGGPKIKIKEIAKAPKIYPPVVDLKDISLVDDKIDLKVVNIKVLKVASGYLFAVFHKGNLYASYPPVAMDGSIPSIPDKGIAFTIRNYKQIEIHIPPKMNRWDRVTFYVFDFSGKLRLIKPMPRGKFSPR